MMMMMMMPVRPMASRCARLISRRSWVGQARFQKSDFCRQGVDSFCLARHTFLQFIDVPLGLIDVRLLLAHRRGACWRLPGFIRAKDFIELGHFGLSVGLAPFKERKEALRWPQVRSAFVHREFGPFQPLL